jgi:hypothetical protein
MPITKFILTKPDNESFVKSSNGAKWIEWKAGKGDSLHDECAIGRSLILAPYNEFHTWLTTPITEIIHQSPDLIEFRTENSTYRLTISSE